MSQEGWSTSGPALPWDTDLERIVLGILLTAPEKVDVLAQRGGATVFYDPAHAAIYEAVAKREREGKAVSTMAIYRDLAHLEWLRDLGGAKLLTTIARQAPPASQCEHYADLAADLAYRRQILGLLTTATTALTQEQSQPAEVAAGLEAQLMTLDMAQSQAFERPKTAMAVAIDALRYASDAQLGRVDFGVKTSLEKLDALIGGFAPGEYTILAARPSMGKTAMAVFIAVRAAMDGYPVIFVSREMTLRSLFIRAMSLATAMDPGLHTVDYMRAERGATSEAEVMSLKTAAERLAHLPLMFLGAEYSTIDKIFAGVRQARREFSKSKREIAEKSPLVFVDYLQLIEEKQANNRYEEVSKISRTLKTLCVREELPFVVLSQLSRGVESRDNKRPRISDLRESGQIEQDADKIIFLYREEYYLQQSRPDDSNLEAVASWQEKMERAAGKMEAIVAKNRSGPIGAADLRCNLSTNFIRDDYW